MGIHLSGKECDDTGDGSCGRGYGGCTEGGEGEEGGDGEEGGEGGLKGLGRGVEWLGAGPEQVPVLDR